MTRGFRRESCVRGVATSTRKVATVEGTVQKDATAQDVNKRGTVASVQRDMGTDKSPPTFSHRAWTSSIHGTPNSELRSVRVCGR